MQQVYEIKKIYTMRQSLSIRHVASGEEGVARPLYFAQQRFLKYSNMKSEWSRSCPSPPPIFWAPSKIEIKMKGNDQWRCSYKDYDNTLLPSPFSRFGKVGVLFVSFVFLACQDYLDESGPYFQNRGYVPVYFEYNNFNFIF